MGLTKEMIDTNTGLIIMLLIMIFYLGIGIAIITLGFVFIGIIYMVGTIALTLAAIKVILY